ncbi:MAG: hypothetical protein AB7J13_14515 [Pyrinomonadaceae bacterium]
MTKSISSAVLLLLLFCSVSSAQKAEVTISLSEAFFDALIDSVYQNFEPPEFSFTQALNRARPSERNGLALFADGNAFAARRSEASTPACAETVKILREMKGVRTAVKFREGKILVPLAFTGSYDPPLIGCLEFAGWAESNLELEFDRANQRLVGRFRVLNINLNGTGGVGGTVIARLLQGTIDRKMNPVEVLTLDKISFGFPIENKGNLRMKPLGIRHDVSNGLLNIHVEYQFLKG